MTNNNPIFDLLHSFALRHYPQRVVDFLDALTVFSGEHIDALVEALTDQDDEVRLLAAEVLHSMGHEAEAALPALIRSLQDPDRLVRVASVAPVAAFGNRAIAAVPILETWLDCGDEFSEVTAAAAIVRIDPSRADDVLPVLVDTLESDDFGVLERLVKETGQGRVFRAPRGGILRPDNVRWMLIKEVIEPLKDRFPSGDDEIGFKNARLHSLRHFFCNYCAHSQVPEQVVM